MFACEKPLGIGCRYPSSFFGDANGDDFVLLTIDCFQDGCSRKQRDFMLAAAAAKEDAYAKIFH
jgi:hypothetical protein